MEERLIVHLQEGTEQIEWVRQNAQGILDAPQSGTFADIKLTGFKGKMVILAPSTQVFLARAKLPKLSEAKLRKALPFAIEDQVAGDIAECHFAYYKPSFDTHSAVAVVQRALMDTWVGQVPETLKSNFVALLPDVLAVPYTANEWNILNIGNTALVRTNAVTGFAVEKSLLPALLAQQLQEEGAIAPEKITLLQPKNADDLAEILSKTVNVPITVQTIDEPPLSFFAKNLAPAISLNLLQGDYKTSFQTQSIERIQRVVIGLTIGWFVLLSAFGITRYAITRYHAAQLESQVEVAYKDIFPTASSVESPKQRVQQALAAVKKAKQQNAFLRILADVSPALVAKPGVEVQGFVFNNDQVDVQLTVSDFQMLDKITTEIRSKGLRVEQSRATKAGDVIQSHLLIKGA
ncbi:MAG: type II secretion system protein GspL [Pseudomonadota bacterium]|nr:type II secretion system protein GspL [Pseudomonadota bacterium]